MHDCTKGAGLDLEAAAGPSEDACLTCLGQIEVVVGVQR